LEASKSSAANAVAEVITSIAAAARARILFFMDNSSFE
jgi:hypothetical protein